MVMTEEAPSTLNFDRTDVPELFWQEPENLTYVPKGLGVIALENDAYTVPDEMRVPAINLMREARSKGWLDGAL